ncbi:mitochondrial import receptor subunit TOM22 homolog [Ischnura elegans]|uniref:mitochondrial import receptor subunit TOM22 homolog n=1 Tax=Ischnura elegans TaxID=197161 RepID=UPI001ED8A374|nr:mitochondrial import receptor subunit TOM22 homolog [Ischnura elegans]
MAPAEDGGDSGMESLTASSKDLTPEKVNLTPDIEDTDDDSDDEDLDETLSERLWGLTEMFPDKVRETSGVVANATWTAIKGLYKFSCNASWIFFTSSALLFAPVIIEIERSQMEEMQKQQQRQILLGPNAAVSGGLPPGPGHR